ncbi:MAG: hypothetical protein HY700_11450 [Gemmatimonadetes bacterium]|nr:hypothetical protein [Gemmatimonadota bacterium]
MLNRAVSWARVQQARGRWWPLVFALALAGGVFALDLVTPRGVAISILYVPVIVLGWRVRAAGAVLALLVLSTVLTVIGYLSSPSGAAPWMAVANRSASILVFGAVAAWRMRGARQTFPRGLAVLLIFGLVAAVFELDVQMPLGVAVATLYVPVALLGLTVLSRRWVLALGLLVTALTVIGWALSPPGSVMWMALANRGTSLFAIWIVAMLGLKGWQTERALTGRFVPDLPAAARAGHDAVEDIGIPGARRLRESR